MCIILDANCQGKFIRRTEDMQPVHEWIDKRGGKLVYSHTDKFKQEMTKNFREVLDTFSFSGRAKLIDTELVEEKQKNLTGLKSNDAHIIALALVSGVKVLVSQDRLLHKDFKKHVNGRIYQNADHEHLLRKDLCP